MVTKINGTNFSEQFFEEFGGVATISSIVYFSGNTARTAGDQTIRIKGTGFVANMTVYIDNTIVSNVSTLSPTLIAFNSPAKSAGTYVLNVVSPSGEVTTSHDGIVYAD